MTLPHGKVLLPTYMPVGTKGSLKGLTSSELGSLGCRLFLGNTYHLHSSPGSDFLAARGGLHKFIGWPHNMLTDSGGFQMVSLSKFCEIDEQGVRFEHPQTGAPMFLRPEDSVRAQIGIGADIIMALDDVVSSKARGPRVREATERTIRWLARNQQALDSGHPSEAQPSYRQNLFPIVQGSIDPELRDICLDAMAGWDAAGFAIGGLSGGEAKTDFIKVVAQSCRRLPQNKPRYLMGVGFPVDLVICAIQGVDMFDCVYATRTARFGSALTDKGVIRLTRAEFATDFGPIDPECDCEACSGYTRAYLHFLVCKEEVACHLLTKHNIRYLLRLMERLRKSVAEGQVEEFVDKFLETHFAGRAWPQWVRDGLKLAEFKNWDGEVLEEKNKDNEEKEPQGE